MPHSQPQTMPELVAFAERLADAARAAILPHFRNLAGEDNKAAHLGEGFYDPVTEGDRAGERAIRALIKSEAPGHGVLGEEYGHDEGSEPWTWILDPVDGTRAFVCGAPTWGTLIALNDGNRPVLGIIDQAYTEDRFVGVTGEGTTLKTRFGDYAVRTRACGDLSSAIMACTDPAMFLDGPQQSAFQRVARRTKLTRYGLDCTAYGLLAAGQVDLVIEAGMKTWDIQALVPVVEAAGGIISDWDGKPGYGGGTVIAAGDKRLYEQAMDLLNG